MKTLAIRLDDELHARLGMLSKLASTSVTDTIRTAIEKHLDTLAADPAITAKAEELQAEIEKEAAQQRNALAALIGSSAKETPKAAPRGRSAKE
jgi:predicted DNA-binding protein